jgi:hypothetical protein
MKLAFRKSAPSNATPWQRFACWVIRARLVSQYSHGGIVVQGWLYHSTAAKGLHKMAPGEWSPENWDIFDVGGEWAHRSISRLYLDYFGAQYDWFSLLAFVGLRVRDRRRLYCFEWCWLAMTGQPPAFRVTPEMLLTLGRPS